MLLGLNFIIIVLNYLCVSFGVCLQKGAVYPSICKFIKLIILIYYIARKTFEKRRLIAIIGFCEGVFALFDVSSHSETKIVQ